MIPQTDNSGFKTPALNDALFVTIASYLPFLQIIKLKGLWCKMPSR